MRRPLPVQHDLTTPRARARAARLRANEAAERREDLAALVTTPVSHTSLHLSVRCRRAEAIRLHCSSLVTVLAQCYMTGMTDVELSGAMGALAPLVRKRENGIH
jgi:hypothetical protein